MFTKRFLYPLIVVVFLIVTACAASTAAPTIVPSSPAPTMVPIPSRTPLPGTVDIGGYALRILCAGQGTPTVIIEAAFGHAPVESSSWTPVRNEIEKTTRICVYDRAGLGSSDVARGKTEPPRIWRETCTPCWSMPMCQALIYWSDTRLEATMSAYLPASIQMKLSEWCWWNRPIQTSGHRLPRCYLLNRRTNPLPQGISDGPSCVFAREARYPCQRSSSESHRATG